MATEPFPANPVRALSSAPHGHATDGLPSLLDSPPSSITFIQADFEAAAAHPRPSLRQRVCRHCTRTSAALLSGTASALLTATATTLGLRESEVSDETSVQTGILAAVGAGLMVGALCYRRMRGHDPAPRNVEV